MRQGNTRRRLAPLCAAGAGALLALGATNASAVTPAQCDARANDTPSKLVECIQGDDLWNHMKNFQAIADANLGPDGMPSRNSGEPGYKASADYVANLMEEAGYKVTEQPYTFEYFAYQGVPVFKDVSTSRTYDLIDEWNPGQSIGVANAQIKPAANIVLPPAGTSSSTSGCSPDDFNGFSGEIALVQRGGCNFGVKVLNAEAKGASGVIIFNEGNPGREGVLNGSLIDASGNPFVPDIPVAFTSFAIGQDLYNQATQGTPPTIDLSVQGITDPARKDYNVIAESKGGDKNHVVVVDAHLDAIYGAGMLDNASGSATILDIAQEMKNVDPVNKLRFIWFGGEELGLLGSKYYVDNLSSSEANHIGYDLDADVTATPNYTIGVLDPAGSDLFTHVPTTETFPNRIYKPSRASRDMLASYFDSIGKQHELFSPVGTDAYTFNKAGIPAGGVLTGQDCCKNQDEVDKFGGTVGNFEGTLPGDDGGCVDNPFRWCDNLGNNDPAVLTFMSKAFADTVVRMAFDTKVMSSSQDSNYQPKLPISSESGSRGRPDQ